MGSLDGKVAIITGAASGIGAAVAAEFAAQGASVVVADINEAGAKGHAEGISASGGQAVAMALDVSDEGACQELVELAVSSFGRLDVLHNNAAAIDVSVQDDDLLEMTAQIWDRTMAVNLRGPALTCKHAIPHMIAGGGGLILNTSSGAGTLAEPTRVAYGASKAALNSLTRYLAVRYGKQGIRAVAVAPGITFPEGGAEALGSMAPGWLGMMSKHHQTPELGLSAHVGKLCAFLATDEARFITGCVVPIDGGIVAGVPYSADMREHGTGLF